MHSFVRTKNKYKLLKHIQNKLLQSICLSVVVVFFCQAPSSTPRTTRTNNNPPQHRLSFKIALLDFISSVQYMIHFIYRFVHILASLKKVFQLTGAILKYELHYIIKDQPAWFWRCPPCGSRNLWQVSFSVKPHFSPGVLSAAHTLFECPHPHRQNQAGKKTVHLPLLQKPILYQFRKLTFWGITTAMGNNLFQI